MVAAAVVVAAAADGCCCDADGDEEPVPVHADDAGADAVDAGMTS